MFVVGLPGLYVNISPGPPVRDRRWWDPAGWLWTGWSNTSRPASTWSSGERKQITQTSEPMKAQNKIRQESNIKQVVIRVLLQRNCLGTRTASCLKQRPKDPQKETLGSCTAVGLTTVSQPSISHCSPLLNPPLAWFHGAYNQCTWEFSINTTHSTSVASLTPPYLRRAQQHLNMCQWIQASYRFKHLYTCFSWL